MGEREDNRTGGTPWGPWLTAAWGLGIIAAYGAVQVYTAGLLGVSIRTGALEGPGIPVALLISAALGLALILLAVRQAGGISPRRYLGLRSPAARTLALWVLAAGALVALGDLLNWLLDRPLVPEFDRRLYEAVDTKPLLWLALVVAAPLFEEVFFRGFLMEGWRRSRLGATGALALTSLLWTLVHVQYGPWEQTWVLAAGFLLGAARLHTGSLHPPLIMHAAINALALIELALVTG